MVKAQKNIIIQDDVTSPRTKFGVYVKVLVIIASIVCAARSEDHLRQVP